MSIDFICYTSKTLQVSNSLLQSVKAENSELFENKFLIYPARLADPVHKEIAGDHRLNAECTFLVSLNEKSFSALIPDVVSLIKNAFDNEVIVLQNNEVPL